MILDAYPRGDVHGPWSSTSAEDWCWGCHSLGRNLWSVYHLCVCLYLSVWLSNHLSSIYLIHHIFFNWLMSNSVLWSPDKKIWLTGKDPDAGKDLRQEEKGMIEDEMDGWPQGTWVWASSRRWCRTGKPGVLQSMGSQIIGHDSATEQKQHTSALSYFRLRKLLPLTQ